MKQKVDLISITKIPPYTGVNRRFDTLYLYKLEFHPPQRNWWDHLWNKQPYHVGIKEFANWGRSYFKDDKGYSLQANTQIWEILVGFHDTLRVDFANFAIGFDPMPERSLYIRTENLKQCSNFMDWWEGVYNSEDFEQYRS